MIDVVWEAKASCLKAAPIDSFGILISDAHEAIKKLGFRSRELVNRERGEANGCQPLADQGER